MRFFLNIQSETAYMLSQRNNMAHIYDGNAAQALAQEIINRFIPAFETLGKSICERYADLLDTL